MFQNLQVLARIESGRNNSIDLVVDIIRAQERIRMRMKDENGCIELCRFLERASWHNAFSGKRVIEQSKVATEITNTSVDVVRE